MLWITRAPQQSVRVGRQRITVRALLPDSVELMFDDDPRPAVVHVDDSYTIFEAGYICGVLLQSVRRGEARLGFKAPAQVRIYREEVWQRLLAEQEKKKS